jgi:hypothetical protein
VPKLPAKTLDWYKDRGGQLVKQSDLGAHWRSAAQGLDLWERGSGPHLLRSVFKSTCRKIGVPDPAIEGQLGHHDSLNYAREWQDETFVAKELAKFWTFIESGVSTEIHSDVEDLKTQLAEERARRVELEEKLAELMKGPSRQQIEAVVKDLLKKRG